MFFVVQDITFVTQLFLCKKYMNAQGGRKLEFLWKDILSSILTSPFVLVIQIYKTHFFIFKMKLDLYVHWALFSCG